MILKKTGGIICIALIFFGDFLTTINRGCIMGLPAEKLQDIGDVQSNEEVKKLNSNALTLKERAQALELRTEADLAIASDNLSEIARLKKAIEAKRVKFTKPLLSLKKQFDDEFKVYLAPLNEADTIIRNKYRKCKAVLVEIARKEEERLRKLAEKRQIKAEEKALEKGEEFIPPPPPVARVETPQKTIGGTTSVKVRKWEIEDATKIPREYMIPDEKKIGSLVRAGIPMIPGVRIWSEDDIRVRSA
jgi:hypothetical protein